MKSANTKRIKRPAAIIALSLVLLLLVAIVPVVASAVEAEENESTTVAADDAPGVEETDIAEEEVEMTEPTGEETTDGDEAAAETEEDSEEETGEINTPEAPEEDEEEEDLEEPEEPEEPEEDAFALELLDITYSALPETAEEIAQLIAGYPYGGTEAEQEEFLQALPRWEEALDDELLPKGWTQKQAGTRQTGVYCSLLPDTNNFAFIFDHDSLKSFLTLAVGSAQKTGLLVNNVQLDEGITTSKNYSGHVLDGDGYTVYAADSGRHLTLTLGSNASLTFKDITFDGLERAGGISINGYNSGVSSQIFMENVTVQNCVLAGTGTVYLIYVKGTITDSSFINNTAQQGGGVYITGRGSLAFKDCRIEENKAQKGGGIYVNYNTSAAAAQAVATFTNCSINGNSSKDGSQSFGMGMYVNNSYGSVSLTNSTLSGNYMEGQGYGVGLYVENTASLTISGTEINDNYGEGNAYGGAFFVDKGKFILRDSLVQNNQTQMYFGGGALYNRTYTTITSTITNTDFIGNFTRERAASADSTNGGGALGIISLSVARYPTMIATTKVEIDGCNFVANRAAPSTEHSYGGAINIALMSEYDDVTIRNTDFERNSAAEGGALFILALDTKNYDSNGIQPGYYRLDAVKLVNCKFKYNVATVSGGAIGTGLMGRMAEQVNMYNAFKSTNVSFTDNMAPTGHQLPTDSQAYPILAYAVERQFGVNIDTPNSDPSRLPLTAPFAVNHSNKYYRSPYNNYDVSQNYKSTIVTSGMFKFIYHANGADTYTGEDTFTFSLMPERNVLLLAPDDGSMGFTMPGYNFVEWNTAYDGSGESYQPGELKYLYTTDFNDDKEFVLYAIWEYNPGAFTVNYKDGQGQTHVDPVPSLVTPQKVLSVQQTGFTAPDGYVFENWKDDAGNIYRPGDEFQYDYASMGSNYTLTAQWAEQPDHMLYLRYVDSEGTTLGTDVLAENPQEIYAGIDEAVVVGNNLASLTRYKALYYTIEGQDAKYSLTDDIFTMTAEKDGTTLLVYCASTMLDITVPASFEFFAMSSTGMEVHSPVYTFANGSDLPTEVRFSQLHTTDDALENIQLDSDGVAFVEEATERYEMHLTLEADSKTANNGFEDRFTGTSGKPGIRPDSLYEDAVVAKLAGGLVKGEGKSPLGAFTIGGQYAGPYELDTRTPKVAFQFHIALITDAEYEL